MEGDYFATQAFAFACCGLRDEADQALLASEAATDHVEALILRGFARTITRQPDSQEVWIDPSLLGVALAKVRQTGNFDGFVVAYRGCPEILLRLSDVSDVDLEPFTSILRTWDPALARTIGFSPALRSIREPGLTQREQEVLSLIRDGLSNREIARTLWISESTVKVHVHNVLGKLGARSRTEAAALSVEEQEELPN
jgi:DNA-binding CsgD family transcriptional regulator